MKSKYLLLILCLLLFHGRVHAQNIEAIGKEKPLKINGGLSFNQMFYDAEGIQSRRDPYTYYLAGNICFNFYGWSVPFSYVYSNQKGTFQQPFNQYGIHPTYKWVTAHLGYSSMSYSPYTLNGHQFLGAGVELAPGNTFRFSAMYGRLKKAVDPDTVSTMIEPSYRRMGCGFKAGMNLSGITFELSTFRSKDDADSVKPLFDSLEIYPEENIALGVNTAVTLLQKVRVQVECGSSIITRDQRAGITSENPLYTRRTSTERFYAFRTLLKYTEEYYSIGATYERIDPGYRTHGSYYFNNDLENVTANASVSLFEKKLNAGANVGIQRDDLNHKKMSRMLRIVHSYNLGFVPVTSLNISASYSNFKSHTNIKSQFENINQLTPYENLDTLTFTQISENTSLNVNYNLATNEKSRQYVSFNGSYQEASEMQEQVTTNSGARFFSMNVAHNYTWVTSNTSFTTAFNYNNSKTSLSTSNTFGPTVGIRKSFLENKMKNSISASYNNTYANGSLLNNTLACRVNSGYTWKTKHMFNLSGAVIYRRVLQTEEEVQDYTEFTLTIGYAYNF